MSAINTQPVAQDSVIILVGTTPINAGQVVRTLETRYDISWERRVPVIAFDAAGVEHARVLSTVQPELASLAFMEHELIAATVGDQKSRQKTAEAG